MLPNRVDFYLLASEHPEERSVLVCRLIEKAYTKGHRVYVHCANQVDAEHIDELLWTFKEDSFIPHNLQGEGPEPPPPVQIGYSKDPRGFNDILINLSQTIPEFYSKFKRIIELVINQEEDKVLSRSKYKTYRSQRCELYTHEMGESPVESVG